MTSKFIVFATFVIVASPGLLSLAYHVVDPVAYKMHTKAYESEHYDHNPKYSYSYDIVDAHTGDIKSQQETRNGDVVEGSYSFIEADGSRRVVHYTADSLHGFNAIIERQPAQHVAVKHVEPAYSKVALSLAHAPVFYQHATLIVKVADPVNSANGYSASAVSHTYYH